MPVTTELRDGAVIVTLRWTDKRNALSADDADIVSEAITAAGSEPDARVLVLTGEGTFSAGGDLPYFAELGRTLTPEEIHQTIYRRVQAMVRALRDSPIPTIAAVDGPAVGLGMDLALACDMRFVGPKGFLMQGWARAGLIAGTGGVALLHRIAPDLLWRLLAEQERITANRAVELGLAEPGEPDACRPRSPVSRRCRTSIAACSATMRRSHGRRPGRPRRISTSGRAPGPSAVLVRVP